MLIFKLFIL